MTFAEDITPQRSVIAFKNKTFGEWLILNIGSFLYPKEEEYEIISVCHFLMQRLGGEIRSWFNMESDTRNIIFNRELTAYNKEKEEEQKRQAQ